MGNSTSASRLWKEQQLPAHLLNNPNIITFLALTTSDDSTTSLNDPSVPVPICGIPPSELSSIWSDATIQLQHAFRRTSPPIHILFSHKRIKPCKWAAKKLRMTGHTAYVYFDERTYTGLPHLDTSILVNAVFSITVRIMASPFRAIFPALTLQVLPASTIQALRALIARWIELEIKSATNRDIHVSERLLAINMVQNGSPAATGGVWGRRQRAPTIPGRIIRADGVEFEMMVPRARPMSRDRDAPLRNRAFDMPLVLPERGVVGEWTGYGLCVVVLEGGVEWV